MVKIKEIKQELSNNYEIKYYDVLDKKVKGILIGGELYHLSGGLFSNSYKKYAKKRVVEKIYSEVKDEFNSSEKNIIKAIKMFLD